MTDKAAPPISAAPICGAYLNSYHISLLAKSRCIWNYYANNTTMKILLIFRFFHNIWFIDCEDLCLILILKGKRARF